MDKGLIIFGYNLTIAAIVPPSLLFQLVRALQRVKSRSGPCSRTPRLSPRARRRRCTVAAGSPPQPPPSFLTAVGAVRAERPLPLAKIGSLACSWLCFAVYEALLQHCCNEAKKKKKKTTTTTKATRRYFTILSTIKAKACRTIVAAMKGTQPPPAASRRSHCMPPPRASAGGGGSKATANHPANTAYSLDSPQS